MLARTATDSGWYMPKATVSPRQTPPPYAQGEGVGREGTRTGTTGKEPEGAHWPDGRSEPPENVMNCPPSDPAIFATFAMFATFATFAKFANFKIAPHPYLPPHPHHSHTLFEEPPSTSKVPLPAHRAGYPLGGGWGEGLEEGRAPTSWAAIGVLFRPPLSARRERALGG
jgi:hypothetical protein